MRTYDFSKMYTNINLVDLKLKMSRLVDQIFTFKSRTDFLCVPRKSSEKASRTSASFGDLSRHTFFDKDELKRRLNFLVDPFFSVSVKMLLGATSEDRYSDGHEMCSICSQYFCVCIRV